MKNVKGLRWSVIALIVVATIITSAVSIAASVASTPLYAVLVMAAVLGRYQMMMNSIQTIPSDFYSGKSDGTVEGFGGMSAIIGVLVFSTGLIPIMSKISDTLLPVMGAALVLLGVFTIFNFEGTIDRVDFSAEQQLK